MIYKEDLSILYLVFQLFLSLWPHGYLFNTLGYNPVLLCLFYQIVPALAIRSSFSWLLYPFDIPHHCGGSVISALPYFLSLQDAPVLS